MSLSVKSTALFGDDDFMKICTSTTAWTHFFSMEETLQKLAEAGFDAIDLSLYDLEKTTILDQPDYLEKAAEIRKMAAANGLEILQAHAPFGHHWEDEDGTARVIRAIEVCGVANIPNIVVHPCFLSDRRYDEKQQEYFDINVNYYNRLRPYAEKAGVKIAIENMFVWDGQRNQIAPSIFSTAEEMLDMLRVLDGPFTVCLDLGHANLNGTQTAAEMIRKLGGEHLGCLHIHDNDGVSDLHTLPLMQKIDFEPIFQSLHDIHYGGYFTYEAYNFFRRLPASCYPAAAQLMVVLAKDFIDHYQL